VRDDKQIAYEITNPGTYYLVADTYVGGSGTEYTGAYLLNADFDGELEPPPEEPPPEEPPPEEPPPAGAGLTDDGEAEGCSCGLPGRRRSEPTPAGLLLMAAAWWMARRRRS
jgi:hypothetical protein